jgi:hypothetical protein
MNRTLRERESLMTELLQDVISLVSMSTFVVAMAFLIGAM